MNFLTQLYVSLLAQAEPANVGAPPPAGISNFLPFILMFLMVYFVMMRPASRQRREHQELLQGLKKDDEIVTTGGIYGRVAAVEDRVITLEIADRVKIKVLRDRIAGMWEKTEQNNKETQK